MGKQSKATKRYKTNKKLVSGKIKSQKFLTQKKREDDVKNVKLLQEENKLQVKEEQEKLHEQQYLQMTSRASTTTKKATKRETPKLTSDDVAAFLNNLKKGAVTETEEEKKELEQLLKGAENEEDEPEVFEQDEEEDEEESGETEDKMRDENATGNDSTPVDEDDAEFMKLMDVDLNSKAEEEETDKPRVTKELITKWIRQLSSGDKALTAAKQLVLALFSAVNKDTELESPFYIQFGATYNRVVIAACKYLGRAFSSILGLKGNDRVPSKKTKKWRKVSSIISIYLKSLCSLLEEIADENLLDYILRDLQSSVHLFGHFTKKNERLLKCMLNFLAHQKETIRFSAFLIVHKMATIYPFPFISTCLKGVYFTLIEKSSTYVAQTHVPVEFLKNCMVELSGIDLSISYKYAFMSMRELAIQLRAAYDSQKRSYLKCYNWPYLNCLDVWTRVLCTYQKQEELRDLVYPIVQIIIGCITSNNSFKYFNSRLKCISLLNELMANIKDPKIYIPVLPHVFAILNSDIGQRNFKKRSADIIDFDFKLRMRTSQASTNEYQQHVLESAIFYMVQFFAINSRSIAFPELAYPAERFLRNYIKTSEIDPRTKMKIKNVIKNIEANASHILERRSKVKYSPLDIEKARNFMNKDDDKEKTPIEKFYEFEKKIRDKEILERIQAKLGIEIEVDNLDEDVSDDEEEAPVVESKKKKPAVATDAKQNNKKNNKKAEGKAKQNTNETAGKGKKRPREADNKKKQTKKKSEPASKKRKTSAKGEDVVKNLNLDDF